MELKAIIGIIVFVAIVALIVYRNWPSSKAGKKPDGGKLPGPD